MRLQRKQGKCSIRPFLSSFRIFAPCDLWIGSEPTAVRCRLWTDRPIPTYAFFGTPKGVPIEIALQLANAVSADAWMNVPIMANDNYITQMATLVHSQLGNTQKIYVELSNEVWNFSFSQYKYAVSQGQTLWPNDHRAMADYEYNREWFGMRTAQMCDIWRSVWRSDPRLVCVLGAQAAWSFSATEALKCPYWTQGAPCSGHAINAVAMAPYMGGAVPSAWTSQADGGLANLFQSLYSQNDPTIPAGGFMAQDAVWKRTSSRISPLTSCLFWRTRADRTLRTVRQMR